MSYRGRPSKGCEGCRSRKVKCDEVEPGCTRCTNSGHECRYRDRTDIHFRNQTALAARRAEDSWRKRSKSHQRAVSEGGASQSFRSSDQSKQVDQQPYDYITPGFFPTSSTRQNRAGTSIVPPSALNNPVIAPAITPDLCRLAYERFVYDFVTPENSNRPPEEPSDALWTFVPLLYQHAAPDSCLATIVNAVSYINFSIRCGSSQAAICAEESFGKGIKLLSKVIADKKQAASDDALCSVLLMGMFENLTNTQQRGIYAVHQHGANALLQLRTIEQYYSSPVSIMLYEVAYTQMLFASLQCAKRPPIPVQDFVSARKDLPRPYNESNTHVVELIWKEARLHALWHEWKQEASPHANRHDLLDMLQNALDLDVECKAWERSLPTAWKYQAVPNLPESRQTYASKWRKLILEGSGAPSEIHTYSNLKRCCVWGSYRTSRTFLLRDTLEILNWMLRMPEPELDVSSSHNKMDSAQFLSEPEWTAKNSKITALDDLFLRILHSSTTTRLVDLIEEGCSAILGTLTALVDRKSLEDVMGIRGYILVWPLGTMDSVLSSGLVPNCNPSMVQSTLSSMQASPPLQSAPPTMQTWRHPLLDRGSMDATEQGSSSQPATSSRHRHSTSLPHTSTRSSPVTQPSSSATAKKPHAFDCTPRHPNDSPPTLPSLDFNIPEPKTMDVAAKREWLNSILYYIGSELGIKKALAVPLMEGYMPVVKPRVESIIGR